MAAAPPGDELLVLEREEAVDRFFDGHNLKLLRRLLLGFSIAAGIYTVVALTEARWPTAVAASLDAVALVAGRRWLLQRPHLGLRAILVAALVAQMAVFLLLNSGSSSGFEAWAWVFVFLPLLFRLRPTGYLAMMAGFALVVAARVVLSAGASGGAAELASAVRSGALVGYLLLEAFVLLLALWATGRRRREFVGWWEREKVHHRDRLRMKEELELAREVQLGMLPRTVPGVDWLDVASLSLPATEVGGDYYDYFELSKDRLGIVVADVAGHGVASGLVLSGVRSGLNLLEDEMHEPVEVLGRLHRMLRRTDNRRMIVTLVLALLDRRERTLTVASAGHPPILRRRSDGDVEELLLPAPPLGALAGPDYGRAHVRLEPGDLVLLYSDGLTETCDPVGEPFGGERLKRVVAALDPQATARVARDTLLREVWDFKGDAAQVDDVTMVVVRVLERPV